MVTSCSISCTVVGNSVDDEIQAKVDEIKEPNVVGDSVVEERITGMGDELICSTVVSGADSLAAEIGAKVETSSSIGSSEDKATGGKVEGINSSLDSIGNSVDEDATGLDEELIS